MSFRSPREGTKKSRRSARAEPCVSRRARVPYDDARVAPSYLLRYLRGRSLPVTQYPSLSFKLVRPSPRLALRHREPRGVGPVPVPVPVPVPGVEAAAAAQQAADVVGDPRLRRRRDRAARRVVALAPLRRADFQPRGTAGTAEMRRAELLGARNPTSSLKKAGGTPEEAASILRAEAGTERFAGTADSPPAAAFSKSVFLSCAVDTPTGSAAFAAALAWSADAGAAATAATPPPFAPFAPLPANARLAVSSPRFSHSARRARSASAAARAA